MYDAYRIEENTKKNLIWNRKLVRHIIINGINFVKTYDVIWNIPVRIASVKEKKSVLWLNYTKLLYSGENNAHTKTIDCTMIKIYLFIFFYIMLNIFFEWILDLSSSNQWE